MAIRMPNPDLMITIEDLAFSDDRPTWDGMTDEGSLAEVDALQEMQILDIRVSPLVGKVAILLEARTALQFRAGNSVLCVVDGAQLFGWNSVKSRTGFTAYSVVGNLTAISDAVAVNFVLHPSAELIVRGVAARFYLLDAIGVSDSIPDYADADWKSLNSQLPRWSSRFEVLQSSYVEPME
ncbi:hypothetical protein [Nocardia camponoti]|uniref:Uncharacterized protein n=1 Tax=Nocardia camponoti TaxID=1616106 RepID=A0A917VB37_9NOCA|nr:hypothetical protein [Nocardia camponoti]GGK59996.1 hypothetical protein GCM10011591_35400 [Nocardia camponoti]